MNLSQNRVSLHLRDRTEFGRHENQWVTITLGRSVALDGDFETGSYQITKYCRANGIVRLDVFGSALRADFGPESDIDLLVEFEPDRKLGLFDFTHMEQELADIFGRKVDLAERSAIEQSRNYIRRAAILGSAETIYAA